MEFSKFLMLVMSSGARYLITPHFVTRQNSGQNYLFYKYSIELECSRENKTQ